MPPRCCPRPTPGGSSWVLGVGYPQQAEAVGRNFARPVETMRGYLTAMDAAAGDTPASYARILGANRPRMLQLAAAMTEGALPTGSTPTDTTRTVLGPDKLLVVYLDAGPDQGTPDQVTTTIEAHLAAGADHVIAGAALGTTFRTAQPASRSWPRPRAVPLTRRVHRP